MMMMMMMIVIVMLMKILMMIKVDGSFNCSVMIKSKLTECIINISNIDVIGA